MIHKINVIDKSDITRMFQKILLSMPLWLMDGGGGFVTDLIG